MFIGLSENIDVKLEEIVALEAIENGTKVWIDGTLEPFTTQIPKPLLLQFITIEHEAKKRAEEAQDKKKDNVLNILKRSVFTEV